MKIIGLTGGIGSGKTTISTFFTALGIPVYIADTEAKKLMETSVNLRESIIDLLGAEAYINNIPNRAYIASKVFVDKNLLENLNALVHPEVQQHFLEWVKKQKSPYCIKEAAILFENGGYKKCDATILVTAPKEVRIKRVRERDGISEKQILERMDNQWDDEKKIKLATYCIENITLAKSKEEVYKIHELLISN